MNVSKTDTGTLFAHQEMAAEAQRTKANAAQQDQEKQAQEAKKAEEERAVTTQKGGEINITA